MLLLAALSLYTSIVSGSSFGFTFGFLGIWLLSCICFSIGFSLDLIGSIRHSPLAPYTTLLCVGHLELIGFAFIIQ